MSASFDPAKRDLTLRMRGLDFADAGKVFAGRTATWIDERFAYGEIRQITAGWLDGRMVIMAWTERAGARHIISMRYCHDKEARKIADRFG